MFLSFIIVNYQSEKYLAKCVSSIKEKISGVDYEIIAVNNDLEAQPPSEVLGEIRLINTGRNAGFGGGCNIGAKEARGDILCFLNPDTEIVSENIQDLLDRFNEDDKLAIIGPRLIVETSESGVSTQWWCAGKEVTILSTILNNLGYKRDKKIWESPVPVECAWVSGAAMFVKKDLFSNPPQSPFSKGGELGGFDEKFFMYFEDIDLCKRARMAGYKVLYYPDFAIKHFGGKSFTPHQKNKNMQECNNKQNIFNRILLKTGQVFFGAGFLDKKEQKRYYRKSQRRYGKKYFL